MGSFPTAGGVLGSLLPPGRNGDQNILQRTDTETTDISMKENCPEIDSYIWHDKSIYNKLGPQNRRHKKHDSPPSPHPRDNWLTI